MIELEKDDQNVLCMQQMILSETLGPGTAGYDFEKFKIVARAMKAVIQNRQTFGKNRLFCSVGALSFIDYICAPIKAEGCQAKQVEGFSKKSDGQFSVTPAITARINDLLSVANNSADPRSVKYSKHLKEAIEVSKNNYPDPYQNIPTNIGGKVVLANVYGWKTINAVEPGGSYVRIPQTVAPLNHPDGALQGNKFYTILKEVTKFADLDLPDQFIA